MSRGLLRNLQCQGGGQTGGECTQHSDCGPGGICVDDGTTTFCTVECNLTPNFCMCPNGMTCYDPILFTPLGAFLCLLADTPGICLP